MFDFKGGITSLTKALAIDEAHHGVRINSCVYFIHFVVNITIKYHFTL